MTIKINSAIAATVVALSAIGAGSVPAMALTVSPTNNTNDLLSSLLGSTPGLSNFVVNNSGTNTPNGFGTFSNDTVFGLGSGIVLSSGDASGVVGPNNASGSTTGSGTRSQLNISFDADNTTDSLFFQYVFGSEEFFEFAQSSFNDFFELQLNGTNLALLPNGNPVTINNLATTSGPIDPAILVANLGDETQLDAFTKVLMFEGLLNKGANNTLSLFVSDAGDSILDSAVFVKGGSITTVPPSEKVPEPALLLGLIGTGVAALRKRRQNDETTEA